MAWFPGPNMDLPAHISHHPTALPLVFWFMHSELYRCCSSVALALSAWAAGIAVGITPSWRSADCMPTRILPLRCLNSAFSFALHRLIRYSNGRFTAIFIYCVRHGLDWGTHSKSNKKRLKWNEEIAVVTGGYGDTGLLAVKRMILRGTNFAILDVQYRRGLAHYAVTTAALTAIHGSYAWSIFTRQLALMSSTFRFSAQGAKFPLHFGSAQSTRLS